MLISELIQTLNREYKISASVLSPFGPVWLVNSAEGRFALKQTNGPAEKISRLFETLCQIQQAGFGSLILPVLTANNSPYFKCQSRYFQLFHWRHGQHPSFTDPSSVQKCARLFANLHKISETAIRPGYLEVPDLIVNLKQRTAFLENCLNNLKNQSPLNRIDRTLLSRSDYYLDQARYALSGLANLKPALKLEVLPGFCHNDPAPRNIIIENGQWYLIDFELSGYSWFILELAKLTVRILGVNDWHREVFESVVKAYDRERKLTDWESSALPYLVCFPQHFWRICNQRFEEKLDWSERRFAARLWQITNTEPRRLDLLKSL